jgi:hypothetical protein
VSSPYFFGDKMKKRKDLEGKCPDCGADLNYFCGAIEGSTCGYDVACTNCEWEGNEWYDLVFSDHTEIYSYAEK